MNANHTPGPWRIKMPKETICKESSEKISIRSAGIHVATIHTGGLDYHPSESAKANARLIASAPELLEACKQTIDRLEAWLDGARVAEKQSQDRHSAAAYHNEMMNYAHLIDVMASAIAKAEG